MARLLDSESERQAKLAAAREQRAREAEAAEDRQLRRGAKRQGEGGAGPSDGKEFWQSCKVGLGRVVAVYNRSSASSSYQLH